MIRRGNVSVALHEDETLKPLNDILNPRQHTLDEPGEPLSGSQAADYLKKATKLSVEDYSKLLTYLRSAGDECKSVFTDPYNYQYTYLQPGVRQHKDVRIGGRTFSTKTLHLGNSAIQYRHPDTNQIDTGFIEAIWSTVLDSRVRTFLIVRAHRRLPPLQELHAPFIRFNPKYGVRIRDARLSERLVIMEHQHVVSHVSTLQRPKGTYGIAYDTIVVCTNLNRGRR
ncbi:hypothetical protein SCHPADRAFT_817764 [Schizopora paradoxa]|uniref:Uncharacterized protein n=1 Tax=Schizopora paradoxa TaxID=27342 RepID=A0A0H2SCV6_9AGAM|nr:hypothetical protein SCHPADRAFT_817764 [Schizopora paradoxa]